MMEVGGKFWWLSVGVFVMFDIGLVSPLGGTGISIKKPGIKFEFIYA